MCTCVIKDELDRIRIRNVYSGSDPDPIGGSEFTTLRKGQRKWQRGRGGNKDAKIICNRQHILEGGGDGEGEGGRGSVAVSPVSLGALWRMVRPGGGGGGGGGGGCGQNRAPHYQKPDALGGVVRLIFGHTPPPPPPPLLDGWNMKYFLHQWKIPDRLLPLPRICLYYYFKWECIMRKCRANWKSHRNCWFNQHVNLKKKKFMYFFHYCFICRLSDSTVSEDAGIETQDCGDFCIGSQKL